MRQDRGIQNPLKKKLSDWRRDAMEQKMIVDLTKTLYVGPLRLSKEYRSFICNAQMSRYNDYDNDNEGDCNFLSRDPVILKTALEQFYEIVQTYKLEEMIQRLTMIDFRAGTEPMDFVLNEEDLPYEEEFLEVEPTFRVTGAVS